MKKQGLFARGVRVRPCSREDLREFARKLRKLLHLENVCKFPVIRFLEYMQNNYDDFDVEIVKPGVLPKGVYAWFNPVTGFITICETYYNMANEGNGFALWTILHECMHYFLHGDQLASLTRQDNLPHKPYEDSEWQADTLTCEILMPIDMINKDMTVEEVVKKFGVSPAAARNRLNKLYA